MTPEAAWIPHVPGPHSCPVDPRTRVIVKLRNGTVMKPAMAKGRDWRRLIGAYEYEIVAYRLAGDHHAE